LGTAVPEICRKLGIAEQTFYRWRSKYAGMLPSDLKRLKQLEEENSKLVDHVIPPEEMEVTHMACCCHYAEMVLPFVTVVLKRRARDAHAAESTAIPTHDSTDFIIYKCTRAGHTHRQRYRLGYAFAACSNLFMPILAALTSRKYKFNIQV
jgi:hypothetical protein